MRVRTYVLRRYVSVTVQECQLGLARAHAVRVRHASGMSTRLSHMRMRARTRSHNTPVRS